MERHDLLTPTPDAWLEMLYRHPDLVRLPLVADWAQQGWPVIVRRYLVDEPVDAVPVALPLPPSMGKGRVAMSFAADAALFPKRSVSLCDARAQAPLDWQATIDGLVALDEILPSPTRVFGALMWQHLTGLTYLSPTSDLDLLWAPADATAMGRLVNGLAALDAVSGVRLDGEIVLPDGGGVNWRELSDAPEMVLVKTLQSVEMRATSNLFG